MAVTWEACILSKCVNTYIVQGGISISSCMSSTLGDWSVLWKALICCNWITISTTVSQSSEIPSRGLTLRKLRKQDGTFQSIQVFQAILHIHHCVPGSQHDTITRRDVLPWLQCRSWLSNQVPMSVALVNHHTAIVTSVFRCPFQKRGDDPIGVPRLLQEDVYRRSWCV